MPDKTTRGHLLTLRWPTCPVVPHHRFRLQPNSVSGSPLRVSIAVCLAWSFPTPGTHRAFPSSTTHLFLHATACGLRRSSTPSPSRVLLCCLRCTLKPSASATDLVEAVPALQGARPPLRPTGFSVYA